MAQGSGNPDCLSHSFQMEHSPRAAEAAFCMGLGGVGGGFMMEDGLIGEQDVILGYERDEKVTVWPYCKPEDGSADTGMGDFIPTGGDADGAFRSVSLRHLPVENIERVLGLGTDTWTTDELQLSIATPVTGIPDPDQASASELKNSLAPAVVATITFDNREGATAMRGFFAVGGLGNFCFLEDETGGEVLGLHCSAGYGFGTGNASGISTFSDFRISDVFRRRKPLRTRHQGMGGLLVEVPAGERREVPLVFGWHRGGTVTLGRSCSYVYTRHFVDLPDVIAYGLERAPDWMKEARAQDEELRAMNVNEHRQFLIAKSVRSYWGSTQLFQEGRRWRWAVNEGSCNMINTLDLTVDMAFFEAVQHPWLLRNVLDTFADEYSYRDTVHFPEHPELSHPGGVSFTHDQGHRNVFTPDGTSHYELSDHPGCFSFMTHEELLNWILCAGIYFHATDDRHWLHRRAQLIADCLGSMQNRDNPDAEQRDGLMSLDSDKCGLESEITTYDSLDPSLGQARRNAYMGVKSWAGYLVTEFLLQKTDPQKWNEEIEGARTGAELAADTVEDAFDENLGYIPAILDGKDASAIIPVIEGLVYPVALGLNDAVAFDGPYGRLLAALKRHFEAVMIEGRCLFPDGGWKLSGNNDNSWMSKIFICQHVAETVLGVDFGDDAVKHDKAHADWWRNGCQGHSVIDQVVAGGRIGGYGGIYPRCVSCWLWVA